MNLSVFNNVQHLLIGIRFGFLVRALIISGLILSIFNLATAEAIISEIITYTTSFENDFIPLPEGLSITVNISHSASGTMTITGPNGFSAKRSLSDLGSCISGILLGAAGTYTVNESYNLMITGAAALLEPVTQSYSASATPWTFEALKPKSTADLEISSNLSNLFISDHSDSINASILDMSATIVTTEAIDLGESVSLSAQGMWTVSTSLSVTEPPPTGTINIDTNLDSASFSISGPENYSGSGISWTKTDALVGNYTIRYGNVDGYFTPATQTATLSENETISFSGTYFEAPTGSIKVTTNLDSATFSIKGPSNYSGSGMSWTKQIAPIGDYTITYGDVAGYAKPASQTATLSEGGELGFSGTYIDIPTGVIDVTTNLDSATFGITGPAEYNGNGASWTQISAPLGEYTIKYHAVPGYTTPPSQTDTLLNDGGTINFSGTYEEAPSGTISVTTNMAAGSFSIIGPVDYNGSGNTWAQEGAPLGEYTITYDYVPGYIAPEPQTAKLGNDETINFSGIYRGSGTLEVNTNLEASTFELSGPSDYSGDGISWVQTEAVVGTYTITYDDVSGYQTPPSETRTLVNGGKITFTGNYIILDGTISVITNLDSAVFDITGPVDYSGGGKIWTQKDAPMGEYTVAYGDVAGHDTPASETLELDGNPAISFTGEYIRHKGTIQVSANLDNITFSVNNSVSYTQADFSYDGIWTLLGVPTGNYTVVYGEMPGYETPASKTMTLTKDETISFSGEYTPIPPAISSVNVSGTPAGAGSTITIVAIGDPGLDATFSIGGIATDTPMNEDEQNPGVYTGEYIVQEGNNIADAVVNVTFVGMTGAKTLNEDKRATIDTDPPAIDSVTVSGSPARSIGDVITVTLMGEPGGVADFRIGNISQDISMTENTEQPGTYIGTYTVDEANNISEAKVVASLRDALGNSSMDESQSASTCIIPWDINKDGIVDVLDIQAVASNLGKAATSELDLNGDGIIDMLDVLVVTMHYGETCSFEGTLLAAAPFASYIIPNYVFQNYPNPCNPETWIPFMLAEGQEVFVRIYNPSGQLVRRLDLGYKGPGVYVSKESGAYWDGRNEYGEEASSGVYFYHIKAGEFSVVRKMLIAR